jgi:hypothetical protein
MRSQLKVIGSITAAWIIVSFVSTPAQPCSVFTAHDAQRVLCGNNEDYYAGHPTKLWFVPAGPDTYGYVAWGYADGYAQGGMNDQGLFWDGLATRYHEVENTRGDALWGHFTNQKMMQHSATVNEAIAFLQGYDLTEPFALGQLFFADKHGNSAIFEGDEIIYPDENYQIATNFLQSEPGLGPLQCWRYQRLTELMENDLEMTVSYFTYMAEEVHQASVTADIYTLYTTIADLEAGEFYLFYDRDWENPIVFVLADELSQGRHHYWMAPLFEAAPAPEPDGGVTDGAMIDSSVGEGGLGDGSAEPTADASAPAAGKGNGSGCGCATVHAQRKSSVFSSLLTLLLPLLLLVLVWPVRAIRVLCGPRGAHPLCPHWCHHQNHRYHDNENNRHHFPVCSTAR